MNTRSLLIVAHLLAFAVQSQGAMLFDRGANWRWRPGTNEASSPVTAWRTVDFNDAQFTTAPAPFWYGDVLPGGTQISGMQGNYLCIFLRLPFVVTNLSEIAGLRLGTLVDDGFVAWINGTEVQRFNMPGAPGSDVAITLLADNAAEPPPFNTYTLPSPAGYLVNGTNILAVQVFQSSLNSSDLGFDASLEAILVETNPPTILSVNPSQNSTVNSLTQIAVTFNEPVLGVDSFDLLINGATAFAMTPVSSSIYLFTFPQPAYGTVQITWDTVNGITDQALPPNPFDGAGPGATWQYTLVDNTPPTVANLTPAANATVQSLTEITVLFSEAVAGVNADDLRINGNPATGLVQSAPDLYTFTFTQPATGVVQVAWFAGHGITDQSPAANPFAGGNWIYLLNPSAQILPPYISEFMALNTSGIKDEDGETSDWIEIYNPSGLPVNLQDWYLTDSAGNLTKWRFPATNLAGGQFLVVWASEKNRRIPGAPLHTNFRLSGSGEYLALVDPNGIVVSQYSPAFPAQAANVSYGLGVLTTNQVLITSNTTVRVQVPANGNEGIAWTGRNYNDSGWIPGTNGVGYGTTNATAADYNAIVLPTQPVGFWRFSESSGTTAANTGSGTGLNGTYNSVALGTAGPRPPQFGGFESDNAAPTFSSSGYVGVGNSLLSGRAAFTMAGWIRPAAAQAARTGLFGQNDAVEFGFISAGVIQVWTPSGNIASYSYPFPDGEWHHITVVGANSQLQLYLDGTLRASAAGAAGSSSSTFNIGGGGIFDATGNFFNGQIDEVVVYHRALSTNEIAALYQGGLQPAVVAVTPYVRTDVGPIMSNVNASAYVRLPFVIENPANVAVLSLKMRYDDGFVAFINGNEVVRANAPETLAFNSAATNSHSPGSVEEFRIGALVLEAGTNVLAIQGLNRVPGDEDFLVQAELTATYVAASSDAPLYFSNPTPGAENVGGVLFPGPSILDASHTPNVPLDHQDLFVTARIVPTFNPVSSVVLYYRVMFNTINPTNGVGMLDDGNHGDGAAGDGVYGATIPASAATNGQMIRWFVRATDTLTNASRWPLFNAPDQTEYLGTIVDPTNVTSKLPIIHLFAPANILGVGPTTTQTGADSQAGARISLFYDGEFYDNIDMNLRGNTTAGFNKKSHRVNFNREHHFRHPGPGGRIRHTSFMADFIDPTYMRQGLSFWLGGKIGVPEPFYYPVRLQLNGQFYQLANHNDVVHEDQVERLGYDSRGALYKAAGVVAPSQASTGGFEKKTRLDEPNTDYQTLAAGINETNTPAGRRLAVFDMLDVPEVINYMVMARWVHENDDVWANMTLYRDTEGDQLWRIIPFDMNLSWGAIYHEGSTPSVIEGIQTTNDIHKAFPMYGGTNALALSGPGSPNNFNRMYDVIFSLPETREMFLRRMRTMLDTCILPPGTPIGVSPVEQHILALRDLIAEEARLDRIWWGWQTKGGQNNFDPPLNANTDRATAATTNILLAVDGLIQEFIGKRRLHFYGKHCITNTALPIGVTKNQNAGIPLGQPPNGYISVAAVEANPASGNQAQEFLCLTNETPFALDISGWKLEGAVQFTFAPGTVMASNSVLYVSPDVRAFRARTTGPRGRQGLFIVGPYSGQLNARGEPITIKDDQGRLVVRTNYPGNPSLAQQHLRISELMYNPALWMADTNLTQELEYLELKNISPSATLDLRGVRFSNGILFVFPTNGPVTHLAPGRTVLVVKNAALFQARYGTGFTNIAGQYAGYEGGQLDNGGERLQLLDASNEEILDFSYNDNWYPITDGFGFSLVIVDDNAEPDAWGRKSQWRASGQLGGSPGANDPAPPAIPAVLVNEALTRSETPPNHTDWIELRNPTASPVDLGGWYLTDDFNAPKKYRIPNGTNIAAGGYIVFTEAQFNPTPGQGQSFALGADGEEVWLFSADLAGNLTGYFHGFNFGAADDGVSFGRHVTSEGRDYFVAQTARTPGAANAGPVVGPIVISELMYHPPELDGVTDNSGDEFIELRNITAGAVNLYVSGQPTNTWKITGGVDFLFPAAFSMADGEYVLLVNFDPANTTLADAFRAKYGVAPAVRLLGPYGGKLNNDRDEVEIKKPTILAVTNTAYVMVDKVNYRDAAPWPAGADGFGLSLQRTAPGAYGNDPAHWIAASPTAAAPAVSGGTAPAITAQSASQTALAFAPLTLNVAASGDPTLRYQWRFGGAPVAEATNGTLTIPYLEPSGAGNYQVTVYNDFGSATSSNITVEVVAGAAFLQQPQSRSVFPNLSASFSAVAYSTLALTYQWRSNGVDLAGANSPTYTLPSVLPVHAAEYSVKVTDARGSIFSQPARLQVITHPIFTNQPVSRAVVQGVNVTNVAGAFSSTPVRYQWFFSGGPVSGGTNAQLILTNVQTTQAGDYYVVASDNFGSTNSAIATLTVLVKPTLTSQPSPGNQVLAVGDTLTLTAEATGTPPLLARWRRNGNTNVAVESSLTLTLTNLALLEAGYYDVVVTNLGGGTTPTLSSRAYVTVVAPPASLGVMPGSNVTLRAVLRGPGPSTNRFWWLRDGATVVREGTNTVTSAAAVSFTNDLLLPNVTTEQAGQYTFFVSNVVNVVAGGATNLTPATKAVTATLVVGDITPPEITCPGNVTVNTDPGQCSADPSYPPPVATDNVGVVGTACLPPGPYPAGATVVTCWAWDLTGNSNSCTFTITVADVQNPTLIGCPAPVTLTAGPSGQVAVPNLLGGVTAADNCGVLSLTQEPAADTLVGGGTNVVTIRARDSANNEATCQTAVIVQVPVTEIRLTVELDGTNAVIRWPDSAVTWILEETEALTSTPDWETSGASPSLENGHWRAVVPVAEGTSKFFRLRRL